MAEILAKLSLQIQAGTANPAPPIGTALGPHGINIVDFCKEYNEKTSDKKGQIIPAEITIYQDRTFSFISLFVFKVIASCERSRGLKKCFRRGKTKRTVLIRKQEGKCIMFKEQNICE